MKEFSQSYTLPKDLKLEDLTSNINDEGILSIEAPLPKMVEAEEKLKKKPIQIAHETAKN